jgi:hypothetical protein
MSKVRTGLLIIFVLLPVLAGAQTKPPAKKTPAPASSSSMIVQPGSEKWGDVPPAALVGTPSVPIGGTLRVAVIQGDPMTAGRTYTLRISCTDGAKIAPHWHPTTENVTVISGTAAVGMGSKWDDAALKDVPAGGFFGATPHMVHFAQCKGDTILQVHGVAPFVLNFVSPDESRPAK